MREIGDLIAAWRALPANSEAVLATVVATSGSTYRRAGARMLLSRDSWLAGSISGGCLEGDVVRTAWERTENGSALVTYDATADEDIVWGFGLGCNGVVQVLLERLPGDGGPIKFLAECHDSRRPGVLATVVSEGPSLGSHYEFAGDFGSSAVALHASALSAKNEIAQVGNEVLLFESVVPPHALTIFGAGHDAVPLVLAAKGLGWHVTVVDWRPAYARADRFPSVDSLVLSRPEATGSLALEPGSAAVVMTHNYLSDLEILRHLLPGAPTYVGLLGPRRRTDRLLSELGPDVSSFDLTKLRAPIGLDIGADEPDEIALAIIAEIQAFFTGRAAKPLHGFSEPLHQPSGALVETLSPQPVACDLVG